MKNNFHLSIFLVHHAVLRSINLSNYIFDYFWKLRIINRSEQTKELQKGEKLSDDASDEANLIIPHYAWANLLLSQACEIVAFVYTRQTMQKAQINKKFWLIYARYMRCSGFRVFLASIDEFMDFDIKIWHKFGC